MNTVGAHAFLFDADHPGTPSYYGGVFDSALLRALSAADQAGATSSWILRGDVLVRSLCDKPQTVAGKPDRSGRLGVSITISSDLKLYQTLVWDIAEAVSGQWHTVNDADFPYFLGRHNVHCICLPTLRTDLRSAIDESLRSVPGYVGALEIDLGNPIQYLVFVDYLIGTVAVNGGSVLTHTGDEGYLVDTMSGDEEFTPHGRITLSYAEFIKRIPPIPKQADLSARGALSRERYLGKKSVSIHERVASELFTASLGKAPKQPFEFHTDRPLDLQEVEVPGEKLTAYILNPDHPNNGGKAKFFSEELGITADDWRYLAAQIVEGLKKAEIRKVLVLHYEATFGIRYSANVPIVGRNGKVLSIETGWIANPGEPARLTTAYPAKRDENILSKAAAPQVIEASLEGDQKWKALYDMAEAAGNAAALICVPTPMKVGGYPVEFEGACGGAYVRILDARRGFARWVIKNGKGSLHYKSGARIPVLLDSQSAERASAYARAFAEILRQNGVTCEVGEYLT